MIPMEPITATPVSTAPLRKFETGATRNTDSGRLDYEGFLSPLVLERFAEYMNKHRVQSDGSVRDSDNWQKGIPKDAYMKSAHRHFFDWWKEHRGHPTQDGLEEALCAVMFNTMGYLFEVLKNKNTGAKLSDPDLIDRHFRAEANRLHKQWGDSIEHP